MNNIDHLAALNWNTHRLLPSENQEEIIAIRTSQINIQTQELDNLAEKITLLAETADPEKMSRIAEKCWEYIKTKAGEKPIHLMDTKYIPPLITCNQIFRACFPPSKIQVELIFCDEVLKISEAEEAILKRESAPFRENRIGFLKVKTMRPIVEHLCGETVSCKGDQFETVLDLLITASRFEINHLSARYVESLKSVIENEYEEIIPTLLEMKIEELKNQDQNIFTNEVLLNSFQTLIQSLLDNSHPYDALTEIPIRSLRINKEVPLPDPILLENLREITIQGCNFNPDALQQLTNLQSITLIEPEFLNKPLFETFGKCPKLSRISIYSNKEVPDDWIRHLSEIHLESLKLTGVLGFTGEGLKYLQKEPLKSLKLDHCADLTKAAIDTINTFPSLTSLSLNIFTGETGEREEIDQEFVRILPKLSLRKLKLCHRDQAVEMGKVYECLPHTLEEFHHSITEIKKHNWQPVTTILNRSFLLKKYRSHAWFPSPLDFESAYTRLSLSDYFWGYVYHLKAKVWG